MANLTDNGRGFPARDMDPHIRRFEFSFAPNAASAVNAALNRGNAGLWSVTRVSQGLFRVTIRDGYREVNCYGAALQSNTATAIRALCGPVNDTNRTFDIFTVDAAGAVQDVAANANNRIQVFITLRCSELKA